MRQANDLKVKFHRPADETSKIETTKIKILLVTMHNRYYF